MAAATAVTLPNMNSSSQWCQTHGSDTMIYVLNSVLMRLALFEGGLLLRARLLLVLRLPVPVRHAVDNLARLVLAQPLPLLLGGFLIPVGEAVAAEAGEVHQVDVLHVGAFAQVRDELAVSCGLKLGTGLVVEVAHGALLKGSASGRLFA